MCIANNSKNFVSICFECFIEMIAICEFLIWYFVPELFFFFFANKKNMFEFYIMISVRVLGVIQRVHLSLVLKNKNIKYAVILMAKNFKFSWSSNWHLLLAVKSKAFEFGNVFAPHPKSGGPGSRERTKSFRLSNMVVDEDSTDVRFKVKVIFILFIH